MLNLRDICISSDIFLRHLQCARCIYAYRILTEDKAMVEQLRPEMLPREISVKADLPQIAFRKLRQEYIDMGYGISPEATANRYRAPDQ